MLAFNVAELIQSTTGATRDIEIEELRPDLGTELTLCEPICGRARFHRTQRGILVQCEASTTAELECSRCLQPFPRDLKIRFTEDFWAAEIPGAVDDEEEDADAFHVNEHHDVDLTEPMRQYFTLEMPLAPLCRRECPGLCPNCGAPLEGHQCPFADSSSSSPFAALADLYRKPNERDSA